MNSSRKEARHHRQFQWSKNNAVFLLLIFFFQIESNLIAKQI